MNMLEIHSIVRKKPSICAHIIKTEYKRGESKVYIVCEGTEDLGYYGQVIKRKFSNIEIRKQFAGGKDNVLEVYGAFDWNVYEKNKLLFFIDRDFSYWTGEKQYIDTNVYITDQYSFENDAVNVEMFMDVLEDFYGFANATSEELSNIRKVFYERWQAFYLNSTYAMAALLVSNILNKEHLAKCVDIKKMLRIESDTVWVESIKGQCIKEYLYEKLKLTSDCEKEIIRIKNKFEGDKLNYFVRGKWALCFMIKLLEYIMDNARKYVPSLYTDEAKAPKRMCELTQNGTMVMLAPRMVPAESLVEFMDTNINFV